MKKKNKKNKKHNKAFQDGYENGVRDEKIRQLKLEMLQLRMQAKQDRIEAIVGRPRNIWELNI